jgi:5-methylcytosine-specific restriction enzyme A
LEVHHIDRLSDGGLDAPNRVAAICPTCHRMVHHGANASEVNAELRSKVELIEQKLSGAG